MEAQYGKILWYPPMEAQYGKMLWYPPMEAQYGKMQIDPKYSFHQIDPKYCFQQIDPKYCFQQTEPTGKSSDVLNIQWHFLKKSALGYSTLLLAGTTALKD